LVLFLQGVARTFEALELLDEDSEGNDEDADANSRSIEAGMHLKVRDEEISDDFLINYFDVLIEGDISSLSQLIYILAESGAPEELLGMDGHIALSGNVTSDADPAFYSLGSSLSQRLHYDYSLFADLGIETDISTTSSVAGTLSGELKYSGVMNLSFDSSNNPKRIPQLITIEVKPFADRSLVDIQDAMDAIDEMDSPDSDDIFDALKLALWGTTSDWCIQITRSVGDASGARIVALSNTWDDADALEVIQDFVSLMSIK